jgi:hypothetical protein
MAWNLTGKKSSGNGKNLLKGRPQGLPFLIAACIPLRKIVTNVPKIGTKTYSIELYSRKHYIVSVSYNLYCLA